MAEYMQDLLEPDLHALSNMCKSFCGSREKQHGIASFCEWGTTLVDSQSTPTICCKLDKVSVA